MLHLLFETERVLTKENLWPATARSLLTEEEGQLLLSWHKRQVSAIAANSIQMLDPKDTQPRSEEDSAIYNLWQRLNTLRAENGEEGVTVESMREYALGTLHVATRLLENLIDTGDGETGLVPLLSRFPDRKYSVEILNNTLNNPLYLRIIHEGLPALLDGKFFRTVYSLVQEFDFSSGLKARRSWLGKIDTQDLQDIAHITVLQRRLRSVINIAIALESMMVSLNKGTVLAGFAQTAEA